MRAERQMSKRGRMNKGIESELVVWRKSKRRVPVSLGRRYEHGRGQCGGDP